MPLCARSKNGRATSDFNPWWYARIVNHFRTDTRSIRIAPLLQQQGALDGMRRLQSSA